MTAQVFFQRLREAQAKTEDFDEVVAAFGKGCPCKDPPLKSKGKTHLKSQTHERAFTKPGGVYFGMSVRAAFEAAQQQRDQRPDARPPVVVHVPGSQNIAQDDADEDESAGMNHEDANQYDEMDEIPEGSDAEFDIALRQVAIDDDDVSDIQVQDQ